MSQPQFQVVPIGGNCYAVNDQGKTVATVSSQGSIDWRLKSPMDLGGLVESMPKETHLGLVHGLKMQLDMPTPVTVIESFAHRVEGGGASVTLIGDCRSKDGQWASRTVATLAADPRGTRYEWSMETVLTCTADAPVPLKGLEYNNIYPSFCGRCMLYAPHKKFRSTIMVDRDGVAWEFPHQHLMHYTTKINTLEFAVGSLAGYFGEPTGAPVVVLNEAPFPADWGICDMYYDLHCCARVGRSVAPGERLTFRYTVKYLPRTEADKLVASAKKIPVTDADRAKHDYPRLELGINGFLKSVDIGAFDDASGFRQAPPIKVWDRQVGHTTKGSLRITNDKPGVTVWSAEPPTEIPSKHTLNITAMVKTQGVTGRGLSLKLRYHTFEWHPQPHVVWLKEMESTPVSGTSDGWVKVSVPALIVPEEHVDYLIWFDVVLDGEGVAWVTDVDVDLQPTAAAPPSIEQGSSKRAKATTSSSRAASGAAM